MTELYEYQTTAAAIVDNGAESAAPTAPEIKCVVTEERMQRLKSGHWRRAQKGEYDAQMHVIAHFMVTARGGWMGQAEALDVLDEYEMGDLIEAMASLNLAIQEQAAPKA